MSEFVVLFDENLMRRSKRGAITAPIYVIADGFCFPEKGWSDFVVVVLSWWNNALLQILSGATSEVEFTFMDGPMLIKISPYGEDKALVQFINQQKTVPIVEFSTIVEMMKIKDALKKVSLQVIDACMENDFISDDIKNLTDSYQELVSNS